MDTLYQMRGSSETYTPNRRALQPVGTGNPPYLSQPVFGQNSQQSRALPYNNTNMTMFPSAQNADYQNMDPFSTTEQGMFDLLSNLMTAYSISVYQVTSHRGTV